jgi:hypothetical protein
LKIFQINVLWDMTSNQYFINRVYKSKKQNKPLLVLSTLIVKVYCQKISQTQLYVRVLIYTKLISAFLIFLFHKLSKQWKPEKVFWQLNWKPKVHPFSVCSFII